MKKFLMKKSKIEGNGIFALRKIKKGEKICIMMGKRVPINELKKMYKSGKEKIDDPFQINNKTYIILKKPYIYFNHSCNPNSGIKGINTLVVIKNIKKDEEITYDYSTTEWTDDDSWGIKWNKIWKIPCKCKSKNCRKFIRTFPSLTKKVKKRYYQLEILPNFIIKKLK